MSNTEKRTDTGSTDRLIWDDLYSYLTYAKDGNVSRSSAVSDELLIQLNRRRIITKAVSDYSEPIARLTAQKEQLYAGLSDAQYGITTGAAGYFYSSVDGYESIWSSAKLSSMTYRDFLACTEKTAESFDNQGYGMPIGKVVTDYQWYIACPVTREELHFYEINGTYPIVFPYNNSLSIPTKLTKILTDASSDGAVLIFRAGILPSEFRYLRNQTVQIVSQTYEGYRVPSSAVRFVDGVQGVYILRGTRVTFRRIHILYEYDGYFLVDEPKGSDDSDFGWLTEHDFIITEGKNLYDGKVVS